MARRVARALGAAAAVSLALPLAPAWAQQTAPTDPAELDPSAPLDPMPDLGVDWPDLGKAAPQPLPQAQAETPPPAPTETADVRRYALSIEGQTALAGDRRGNSVLDIPGAIKNPQEMYIPDINKTAKDYDLFMELIGRS